MSGKGIWVTAVSCILAVFVGITGFAGNSLVNFAIGRDADVTDVEPPSQVSREDSRTISSNWQHLSGETREWEKNAVRERVTVLSWDGLTLCGEYVLNPGDSRLWVIAVHGYRGNHSQMTFLGAQYGRRGYNVLLPDLRGCGESGGDFIGMGWLDRKDMLSWIGWIIDRDPEARIVLHGISMGGATVMMTAGEDLPPQVRAVVEDCGYTSVWDIFKDEMAVLFHLPAFPVLQAASAVSSLRAGYNFGEASALEQVRRAKVPILFIHGEKDNFVNTAMVYPLYEACSSEKQLLVVEGAGHASSFAMDPERYFGTVFDFLEEYTAE